MKTISKKIDKNSMSVSPRLFCFIAFSGVSQRWEFKNTQKTFCNKHRVEKFLQNIRPKIQNRFFLDFVYHVFGRFSVRAVQKHDLKKSEKNPTPSFFRTPTHPPTTGVTDFFFSGPLLDAVGHRTASGST
jgi:hypothetical protein